VASTFKKKMESILQEILKSKKDWLPFTLSPNSKIKSTNYHLEYPTINARLTDVSLEAVIGFIEINIDWYYSDDNTPYYSIRFFDEPNELRRAVNQGVTKSKFENVGTRVAFKPVEGSINFTGDFRILMDGYLAIINGAILGMK